MKAKRLCKLCGKQPAKVPDRENPRFTRSGPIDEICLDCHAERLRSDLIRVVKCSGP